MELKAQMILMVLKTLMTLRVVVALAVPPRAVH